MIGAMSGGSGGQARVAVEVAVFEFESSAFGGLGDEPDFDLAGVVGVRLDLPVGADVPTEHHAILRLVGEHSRPVTFGTVDGIQAVNASGADGLLGAKSRWRDDS